MVEKAVGISEAAAASGVNIETIRYYERAGLAAHPARSAGGRRLYTQKDIRRLLFIKRCRALGFPLAEVRSLLAISDGEGDCRDVEAMLTRHLEDVRAKLRDLRRLEKTLADAKSACAKNAGKPDCPLIDMLSG